MAINPLITRTVPNRQNPINLVNIVGLLELLVFDVGSARELKGI